MWIVGPKPGLVTIIVDSRLLVRKALQSLMEKSSYRVVCEVGSIGELNAIALKARDDGNRHLVLVTGVPGAGKTLLSLQFVYNDHFDQGHESKGAVMLSGNGPLVKVLQHALKSRVFVGDVHGFLKQYGGQSQNNPKERIFVYDEAQRAWDAARVREKRGHGASEPMDFVNIGDRLPDWCVMVGLIGEGQEIHLGEEAGIIQWAQALENGAKRWVVHCPADCRTMPKLLCQSASSDTRARLRPTNAMASSFRPC